MPLEGLLGAEQLRCSGPERITFLLRLSAKEENGKDTVRENHCLVLEPATETESESCISVGVRFVCVREVGDQEIVVRGGKWNAPPKARLQLTC